MAKASEKQPIYKFIQGNNFYCKLSRDRRIYLTCDAALLTIWAGRNHWTPSCELLCKDRAAGGNESSTNLSQLFLQKSTMCCHFARASSSSLFRRDEDGSLSWRIIAAGAGGDNFKRLRPPWHISQLNEFKFLLWNVQVVHCHPSPLVTATDFVGDITIGLLFTSGFTYKWKQIDKEDFYYKILPYLKNYNISKGVKHLKNEFQKHPIEPWNLNKKLIHSHKIITFLKTKKSTQNP